MLSIVKEGMGTLTITGNDNFLSGALRILDGRVHVMNDRSAAESGGLRGALGAMSDVTKPVAYVFSKGILGGTLHPSLTTPRVPHSYLQVGEQPIYDLQGRRIESSLSESVSLRTKLKPGLYVSKGSKWVVR